MMHEIEEKIIEIGKFYVSNKNSSISKTAKEFGIPYSTMNKILNIDLKTIDLKLWEKVQKKKEANIARSRQNFVKPKKVGLIGRLFKR